ncbi:MAG: MBL fold metallo-hydrolase [Deltaproteobacteria bacterium]|nr:MBL fold metallo-hydrolase [Deltaproteobacteria bacterium]
MIEPIRENLFRMEIPLPESPLKFTNSYVILDPERNLVIDTGFNRPECLDAMTRGLKELDVDLQRTDLLITHLHADHFGLAAKLASDTSRIYFNRPDAEAMQNLGDWEPIITYAAMNGFPEDGLRSLISNHPGIKYGPEFIPELTFLDDGDTIRAGGYLLLCIQTPGHTRGHICLYEQDKRILFSGDHILHDITPNIQCWWDHENPLKNYLSSLERVQEMEVDLVLPGHRRRFTDCRGRILELKEHHRNRVEEVMEILARGPKNAYGAASYMTWDIACDSWEQFPVAQKWFATGEAISHLRFLEEEGRVVRETGTPTITYKLGSSL